MCGIVMVLSSLVILAARGPIVAAYTSDLDVRELAMWLLLFVAAFQLVLERPATVRQWAVLLAIAIGTSAVTYSLFNDYLFVLLPRGLWTNW